MKYQIPTPRAFIAVLKPATEVHGWLTSETIQTVDRIAGMAGPNVSTICAMTADMRRPLVAGDDYDTAALLLAKMMDKYRKPDREGDWTICTPAGYMTVDSRRGNYAFWEQDISHFRAPMIVERKSRNRGSYSYCAIVDAQHIKHDDYIPNTTRTNLSKANQHHWFKLVGTYPSDGMSDKSRRIKVIRRAAEIVAFSLEHYLGNSWNYNSISARFGGWER